MTMSEGRDSRQGLEEHEGGQGPAAEVQTERQEGADAGEGAEAGSKKEKKKKSKSKKVPVALSVEGCANKDFNGTYLLVGTTSAAMPMFKMDRSDVTAPSGDETSQWSCWLYRTRRNHWVFTGWEADIRKDKGVYETMGPSDYPSEFTEWMLVTTQTARPEIRVVVSAKE